MKKSTHVPTDSVERQHYKKKYLERVLEEQDAEREIKQYRHNSCADLPPVEVPQAPAVD